jgi:hypothetical protein
MISSSAGRRGCFYNGHLKAKDALKVCMPNPGSLFTVYLSRAKDIKDALKVCMPNPGSLFTV